MTLLAESRPGAENAILLADIQPAQEILRAWGV